MPLTHTGAVRFTEPPNPAPGARRTSVTLACRGFLRLPYFQRACRPKVHFKYERTRGAILRSTTAPVLPPLVAIQRRPFSCTLGQRPASRTTAASSDVRVSVMLPQRTLCRSAPAENRSRARRSTTKHPLSLEDRSQRRHSPRSRLRLFYKIKAWILIHAFAVRPTID